MFSACGNSPSKFLILNPMKRQFYDIIGDVHGHATLLKKLNELTERHIQDPRWEALNRLKNDTDTQS